jgi:hypothetical protein
MPLKLNVGISRKVGQPNYGSLGAQCNMEVELDGSILNDPDALRRQIAEAYSACSSAVHDELAGKHASSAAEPPGVQQNPTRSDSNGRNGSHSGNNRVNGSGYSNSRANSRGNGRVNGSGSNENSASAKQHTYIHQLAGQIDTLGVRRLDELCDRMYSKPLVAITTLEASGLIDTLKDAKLGKLDLADLLAREVCV